MGQSSPAKRADKPAGPRDESEPDSRQEDGKAAGAVATGAARAPGKTGGRTVTRAQGPPEREKGRARNAQGRSRRLASGPETGEKQERQTGRQKNGKRAPQVISPTRPHAGAQADRQPGREPRQPERAVQSARSRNRQREAPARQAAPPSGATHRSERRPRGDRSAASGRRNQRKEPRPAGGARRPNQRGPAPGRPGSAPPWERYPDRKPRSKQDGARREQSRTEHAAPSEKTAAAANIRKPSCRPGASTPEKRRAMHTIRWPREEARSRRAGCGAARRASTTDEQGPVARPAAWEGTGRRPSHPNPCSARIRQSGHHATSAN